MMNTRRIPTLALIAAGVLAAAPYALAETHGVRYGRIMPAPTTVTVTMPARTVTIPARDDYSIEQRVHEELELSLGSRADAINVDVQAGTVYLTGWVPTETDRRLAHDAAYSAYGVRGLSIANLRASTYRY